MTTREKYVLAYRMYRLMEHGDKRLSSGEKFALSAYWQSLFGIDMCDAAENSFFARSLKD